MDECAESCEGRTEPFTELRRLGSGVRSITAGRPDWDGLTQCPPRMGGGPFLLIWTTGMAGKRMSSTFPLGASTENNVPPPASDAVAWPLPTCFRSKFADKPLPDRITRFALRSSGNWTRTFP